MKSVVNNKQSAKKNKKLQKEMENFIFIFCRFSSFLKHSLPNRKAKFNVKQSFVQLFIFVQLKLGFLGFRS